MEGRDRKKKRNKGRETEEDEGRQVRERKGKHYRKPRAAQEKAAQFPITPAPYSFSAPIHLGHKKQEFILMSPQTPTP